MPSISINNRQLHYTCKSVNAGRPALIFVHGAGGCSADWPYLWQQEFAPSPRAAARWITDYPRFFLDLPGHGRSQPPARTSISAYAEDVLEFLDVVGIRRAVIVGHSMGAAIALCAALRQPEKLAGLVTLGGGPVMPVSDLILHGLRENFPETVGLIMKFSWRREARPLYREVATQHMLAAGAEVVYGDFAACSAFDIRSRLGEIRLPALILGSTSDRMMPLAQSEALAAAIPNARLAGVEDGGHFLMTERTGSVTEHLLAFLSALDAPYPTLRAR